jgi:hypothetical protein
MIRKTHPIKRNSKATAITKKPNTPIRKKAPIHSAMPASARNMTG